MRKWLLGIVLALAASALVLQGCGSDSPTGPGGGTPGSGTKVSAGVYDITFKVWTCGMMDTTTQVETATFCSDFGLEVPLELDCPITISNNSFTVDCTSTRDDGFCSYTERVQATGTYSGTTWTITGTRNITNENPSECSGEAACQSAIVTITRTGDAPAACSYADENTVDATITGGPFAGNTTLDASGFVTNIGGLYSWTIFGGAATGFAAKRDNDIANIANLNLNLVEIDPQGLPTTFDVTVTGGGVSRAALANGTVSYYDQTTSGTIFYSVSGSGSITVNEVSGTYIAGRINSLTINGQEYVLGGMPTAATRTISGGFYVLAGSPTRSELPGWLGRLLD
jgi:hypothetical protein